MKKKKILLIFSILIILIITMTLFKVKRVVIEIDGKEKVVYTLAKDYKTMLKWHFIEVLPEDQISVPLAGAVRKDYRILISKAQEVNIEVDGKVINHKTTKNNISDVLQELNIKVSDTDKINKDLDGKVIAGDIITITRVEVKEEIVKEAINFNTRTVKDYKTYLGETRKISEGKEGEKSYYYSITYEDGKEVSRVLTREEVTYDPQDDIVGEGIFDPNSLTVCVNRSSYLSSDFIPKDLVYPNVRLSGTASNTMMRQEAASALEILFNAAEADGIYLSALSGYRSYYTQQSIYNPYSGYSAPPGASEHQLGLAMDVTANYYGTTLTPDFVYTTEGQWIANNAHKYGFVIRYLEGKENVTGYYYEPWHIRYLGVELATELFNKGITLEEYYGEY